MNQKPITMKQNELIERKLRGSATLFKDGSWEFTPQGHGSPRFEEVVKVGQSALCRTAGLERQSLIAHLKVDASEVDQAAALQAELDKITRKLPGQPAVSTPRGRVLLKEEGVLVAQNATKGQLEVLLTIDLRKYVDFMKEYYKLTNLISRCLHYNEDSTRQLCRALAKSSTKQ